MAGPSLHRSERREVLLDAISVVLFGGLVLLALATFADYGTSWDEHDHIEYGDDIVKYFRAGMTEAAVPDHHQSYGGGYNLAAALFSSLVPHPRHTSNHLFTALVGLVGLMGAWRLGRLLGGAAGGLVALLLLATLPAYWGHMFNNPKDLPFAAGYVWMLYYLCRLIQAGLRAPTRLWIALAVALGLGMTVRIAGLLGIGYLAIIMGAQWVSFCVRERRVRPALKLLGGLTLRGALVTAAAWALMILAWPYTHRAPFTAPFESLRSFSEYGFKTRTLFRGAYVRPNPPPWDYVPGYFAVQLPDVLWLILAIGVLMLVVSLTRPSVRSALWSGRGSCVALLMVAILFPLSYAIVRKSTIYDGLRHFLFVLPPLCVLAAVAVSNLLRWLAERSKPTAYATLAVLGFGVASAVVEMVQLHPYQYVYFNRMSGGLEAAATQYETEYYAHSFKELGEKLADHLWQTERDRYLNGDYSVMGCGIMDYFLLDHMPANFSAAREPPLLWLPHDYDFYASYRRLRCNERRTHLPLVVAVERQGVALNVMRDMRQHEEGHEGGVRNP
jgi:hypothetical protein